MNERAAPFVSGIANRTSTSTPVADPRGCALLHAIRQLARDQVEELTSRCRARFDGSDRISPDPTAVAQRDVHEATIRLINQILADPELARRVAASLRI
jgi:hypothetical protein